MRENQNEPENRFGFEPISEIKTRKDAVKKLAEAKAGGLYLLEDGIKIVEPFGEDAVSNARARSDTFFNKGALPHGGASPDDEAIGAYEIAQIAIRAEGGETLAGKGAGNGFYARSAYRLNMWRLAEMIDGVSRDGLGLNEPTYEIEQ